MTYKTHYLENLARLGYSERECRFLYLVATHSGVFTRQHYDSFCGIHRGSVSQTFLAKLVLSGHARPFEPSLLGTGQSSRATHFHVYSKSIYGAVRNENSSLRNLGERRKMLQKLLALTFVIDHQEFEYFETEPDKVLFFTDAMKLEWRLLPVRTYTGAVGTQPVHRYFVDRFPLGRDPNGNIVFTYLDDETERMGSVKNHFAQYAPLWRALPQPIRLYFVSQQGIHARLAEELFKVQFVNPHAKMAELLPVLRRIFELKRKQETGGPGALSHEEVVERGDLIDGLNGFPYQPLYESWKREGMIDLDSPSLQPVKVSREFRICTTNREPLKPNRPVRPEVRPPVRSEIA